MQDNEVTFNVFEAMKNLIENEACFRIHMLEKPMVETMISQIDDSPSDEALNSNKTFTTLWYANIVNYLACGIIPPKFYQRKKKFLSNAKYYQ